MRNLICFLCACETGDAKPMLVQEGAMPSFGVLGIDNYVIGGSDAQQGVWKWQLSQERLGAGWSHSCGASLLSTTKALSASHCVDGT